MNQTKKRLVNKICLVSPLPTEYEVQHSLFLKTARITSAKSVYRDTWWDGEIPITGYRSFKIRHRCAKSIL
ncbi:hypothetical protein CMALT430_250023 [Carnobacterium maltaromaticum]|nr:hypothetical protein CMALT430_250023 [Carnobacterium maltaromaticum]